MTFAARKPTSALICGAALALLLVAAPAVAQETSSTWYAQRITSGDTPLIVEYLWSKGPKQRAETVIGGHPIITLVNGERYITIDRLANTGVSIQRSPTAIREDGTRSRPFGNEGALFQASGAEKVSTETIAGRSCDLYRLTNNEGRKEVCVSRDETLLPLQLKVWRRAIGKEAVTRYLDWTSGLALSDEFFEPDPAVTLEHLSYDDYLRRAVNEQIGPAPPFFRDLLHGAK
jgi:outer membrane lipoprotein-sorting protein